VALRLRKATKGSLAKMWRITLFLREEKDNKNKPDGKEREIQHMMSTSSAQTASQFVD
jgi:hypothetical protein